tara:strand:- start:7944 stop:8213 length:270 start_codon:yes stop_codon:yes gene_type:complete
MANSRNIYCGCGKRMRSDEKGLVYDAKGDGDYDSKMILTTVFKCHTCEHSVYIPDTKGAGARREMLASGKDGSKLMERWKKKADLIVYN